MIDIRRILKDRSGASAIEYALLIGLIAAVGLTGLKPVGTFINDNLLTAAGEIAPDEAEQSADEGEEETDTVDP